MAWVVVVAWSMVIGDRRVKRGPAIEGPTGRSARAERAVFEIRIEKSKKRARRHEGMKARRAGARTRWDVFGSFPVSPGLCPGSFFVRASIACTAPTTTASAHSRMPRRRSPHDLRFDRPCPKPDSSDAGPPHDVRRVRPPWRQRTAQLAPPSASGAATLADARWNVARCQRPTVLPNVTVLSLASIMRANSPSTRSGAACSNSFAYST